VLLRALNSYTSNDFVKNPIAIMYQYADIVEKNLRLRVLNLRKIETAIMYQCLIIVIKKELCPRILRNNDLHLPFVFIVSNFYVE